MEGQGDLARQIWAITDVGMGNISVCRSTARFRATLLSVLVVQLPAQSTNAKPRQRR